MKVVVVAVARTFIPRGLAGHVHALQLAVVLQLFEVAVDGGDAEAGNVLLRRTQDLGGRQRPAGQIDGGADGITLAGIAFHGRVSKGTKVQGRSLLLMIMVMHYQQKQSLLMWSVPARVLAAVLLLAVLWLAAGWALHEVAV